MRKRSQAFSPILSYSQEGEDLILDRLFEGQERGFYVDIGAHHPFRYSNTALFYKKGWRGINIDPLPGTKKLFDKYRPRDINLEIGVSTTMGKVRYYMFNEPALNTFDEKLAKSRHGSKYSIVEEIDIKTMALGEILDKYHVEDGSIDFISIDTEGVDIQVIKSCDWNKYRPKYLLVEALDVLKITDAMQAPVVLYLAEYGYELIAKTVNSLILGRNCSA